MAQLDQDRSPAKRWLASIFGIDVRGLALFRIGLAILLLVDLWNRSFDLVAHYTDVGVLPREAKLRVFDLKPGAAGAWWSLHTVCGEPWCQWLLLLAAAGAAICLLVGYRTWLATLASWILLVSLHNRNPLLLQGGDTLLRMILFWSLFLPLGTVISVDARRRRPRRPPSHVLSGGSAALLVQVALMYFFTACQKAGDEWLVDGSAVHYALSADHFAKPLGTWLLQFPSFLRLLTWATVVLEFYGPLLAFFPIGTARLREILVPVFWFFHLCLGATMALGLFPAIAIVAWIPFLPSRFWDAVARRWPPLPRWPDQLVSVPRGVWSWTGTIIPLILVAAVAADTARGLPRSGRVNQSLARVANAMPQLLEPVIRVGKMNQSWKMFSPRPLTKDGWFEFRGTLRDGSVVNLWRPGQPLSSRKPAVVSDTFGGQRWRKYLIVIREPGYRYHRRYLREWLRWRWDTDHAGDNDARRIKEVKIIVHVEPTRPPGQPPASPHEFVLHHWIYP